MNLELVPALQHQLITISTFGTQLGSRASSALDPAAVVQENHQPLASNVVMISKLEITSFLRALPSELLPPTHQEELRRQAALRWAQSYLQKPVAEDDRTGKQHRTARHHDSHLGHDMDEGISNRTDAKQHVIKLMPNHSDSAQDGTTEGSASPIPLCSCLDLERHTSCLPSSASRPA